MKSLKQNSTRLALAGALAAVASAHAAAGTITEPVAVTLENVGQPVNYYSSLMLFPMGQQGEYLETTSFDINSAPSVFIGDENSPTPRAIAGYAFLDEFGEGPGDYVLRIDFPANDPWSPDEMLTFRFTLTYEEGDLWKIDVQLTPVPAPAAVAGLGLLGLAAARRRRS